MGRRFPLLLRRDRLLSRESLPSFVTRLAQANYYSPVTILNQLCFDGLEKDRLDWPSKGETYERLFALTWIGPHELHDATGHFFAEILTPPGIQIESLQVPGGELLPVLEQEIAARQLRPEYAAQFCPLCLRMAPYHRIAWMPVAAAACITHKRLLVDRCPGCQAKVPIRAIVEHCRCRRCKTDFRDASSARLGDDIVGLRSQRFIRWWLKLGRAPVDSLHYNSSRRYSRPMLYIIAGLVDSIKFLGSDWSYMHRPVTRSPLEPFGRVQGTPTPDQSYRLYATAFNALTKWPQEFHKFLRAYAQISEKARGGFIGNRSRLYSRWLSDRWADPIFSFVQEAFSRYLVDTYVTSLSPAQKCDLHSTSGISPALAFISTSKAAQLLGVSIETIKRLADIDLLVRYTAEDGGPRRYGTVRQDEVLTLRLRWQDVVPLEDAVKWLGLIRATVINMAGAGLLTADFSPSMDGDEQWGFNKQSLDEFYSRVAGSVRTGKGYSSLAEVTRALSVFGLNVIDVFKLIVDGKLRGWSQTKLPALAKLTFNIADVESLLESPESGRGLLNNEDAAHRLGVTSATLFRWVRAGLFSVAVRYAHEDYFDPDVLDGCLSNLLPSEEAAEMLGVEVEELEGWYWDWGLDAMKGTSVDGHTLYLFRREDVEKLKVEFSAAN